jgi:2,4-dienoyl-CoA reductase-like NADH-dependent reductase (Old Yellow Enzyme family)
VYLLREVERFLSAVDLSAARFGREVMGDPRFVFDLRKGREPKPQTIEKVKAYLESAK